MRENEQLFMLVECASELYAYINIHNLFFNRIDSEFKFCEFLKIDKLYDSANYFYGNIAAHSRRHSRKPQKNATTDLADFC